MIKQHTAQSLGKYLGNKVEYGSITGKLTGISTRGDASIDIEEDIRGQRVTLPCEGAIKDIYPILKTYTKLIEPMLHEGNEIIPAEYIYGLKERGVSELHLMCPRHWNYKEIHCKRVITEVSQLRGRWEVTTCIDSEFRDIVTRYDCNITIGVCQRLHELNFGAIENPESPTGFVDLFGYPCVAEGK